MSRKLFVEAPLELRMKIKSVYTMRSFRFCFFVQQFSNGACQLPNTRTAHEHDRHILRTVARLVFGIHNKHGKNQDNIQRIIELL